MKYQKRLSLPFCVDFKFDSKIKWMILEAASLEFKELVNDPINKKFFFSPEFSAFSSPEPFGENFEIQ